jgi:hypothetical protein
MTDDATDPAPTPAAITDAQLAVVGLARNARTVDNADAVSALLADADPLLCLLFAARLINTLCRALARETAAPQTSCSTR